MSFCPVRASISIAHAGVRSCVGLCFALQGAESRSHHLGHFLMHPLTVQYMCLAFLSEVRAALMAHVPFLKALKLPSITWAFPPLSSLSCFLQYVS